jgi:cell wall-associated NlpC family hydrolase
VAPSRKLRAIRASVTAVVILGALVATPLVASAAPVKTPTTSAEVVASLAKLAVANEKLTERFNQSQIEVKAAERDAAAATREANQALAHSTQSRQALASSLAAQYKSPSFSRTAALLTADSGQNYLETMESLNIMKLHQAEIVRQASTATASAVAAATKAKTLVTAALAKRTDINQQRDALTSKIAKQKQLLAELTAAERARYLAQLAPVAAPAKVAAATTQIQTRIAAEPVVAKSRGANAAVQAALSQQGKPYVWGAGGPDAYDCSGLTSWAWGQAGVSLPHQSASQQGMGTPVGRDQLQPGDLVFFGSPAYHVGMYIGNGMMVHAPTSGDVVKISPLDMMSDYSGATRVG